VSGPGLYESANNGAASGDIDLNTFTTNYFNTSSYDPGKLKVTAYGNAWGATTLTQTASARADVKITNGAATILMRKPKASTATANEFAFDSVSYETGNLSWLPSVLMLIM
jgi:hypothetical protein